MNGRHSLFQRSHGRLDRWVAVVLSATMVLLAGPSATLAFPSFSVIQGGGDKLYFTNADQLYWIDLADYRANSGDFARGDGGYTLAVHRAIFPGSPREAEFEFGTAPYGAFKILGTNQAFVEQTTRLRPGAAYRDEPVATLRLERHGGVSASTIQVARDRVRMQVPDALIEDPTIYGGRPVFEFEVNGVTAQLDGADLEVVQAILAGRAAIDEHEAPSGLDAVEAAFHDQARFTNVSLGLLTLDRILRTSGQGEIHRASCYYACSMCLLDIGVTGGGIVAVALSAGTCSALCSLVIAGGIAGAGAQCGDCLVCLDGGGGTGGNGCPTACGGSGQPVCPEGCCPDGTTAGPNGCEDDDECDPIEDPDGCTCPLPLQCP